MEPLSELERRHIEEQLGGVRATLVELRQELELIKAALVRAQGEAAHPEPRKPKGAKTLPHAAMGTPEGTAARL